MEPAMSAPAEQGQQKVRQDSQDAPDRHPRVAEQMDKSHNLRSGRLRSQSESGTAHSQKEHVGAKNHCRAQDADQIDRPYQMVHCPSGFLTVAAPICWNTSSRFSSSQCSTNFPSLTRQMSRLSKLRFGFLR